MSARRLSPILLICLAACFDPPELDELSPPPLADLGTVDTWAPLDEAGPPSSDDSPSSDGPGGLGPDPDLEDEAPGDPALAQLRIREVLVDPEGKDGAVDSPEFIEISNPGPSPVKLAGLRVKATSWPIMEADELGLTDVELAAGDLLVIRRWATDVDAALAGLEVADGVVWVGFLHSGGLRNNDGSVVLETGSTLIDQLDYDAPPGSGVALCRTEKLDWVTCNPSPGSLESPAEAGAAPDPIAPGALQIVEVAANPPGPSNEEKSFEYIEIVNMSEDQLELGGCRIGDAPTVDAPGVDPLEYLVGDGGCDSPTCLAPGARALIVGQGFLGETGGALVLATDDSTLADGGLTTTEPVVLWDASDAMISSYRLWPDPAGDPLPTDEQPLHRIDPSAADEPQSWISAPGSPGS